MAKKILKTALSPLGSALGLFGGKKKPKVEAGPIVMPIADDEAVMTARKRAIASQMKRGGRSSTILTDSGTTLGS